MTISYQIVPLFGGAISAEFPTSFIDVSDLRPVPSHQEVYVSGSGLTSVIIDITQRLERPAYEIDTDGEAIRFHFIDMLDLEEGSKVLEIQPSTITNLPNISAYTLLGTTPKSAHYPETQGFVALILTVIRLEAQKTDLLVTTNVPHPLAEAHMALEDLQTGKHGPLIEGKNIHERVLETIKINDWSLFVTE